MVFTYLDFFGESEKVEDLKEQYKEGKVSDVAVKEYLFDSLLSFFAPARKAYEELKANPNLVKDILKNGQAKAMDVSVKTMTTARDAMGITTQYSFFQYPKPSAGNTVSIEDFARINLTVGHVLEARNKEGSEKLIRLLVNIGEDKPRVIFTGVRGFGYTPEDFAGKQFFFITNLAPRKMLDEESQGMILAVDGKDKPIFLSAEGMPIGATIR
jgi:methionine--tRNA ligase beta chain